MLECARRDEYDLYIVVGVVEPTDKLVAQAMSAVNGSGSTTALEPTCR